MYDYDSTYFKDRVSTLMKRLGRPDLLDVLYGLSGSGASSANAPIAFQYFGLESEGITAYDWDNIYQEIAAHYPVYVRGNCFKHTELTGSGIGNLAINISYSGGHAWVLDGIIKLRRQVTVMNMSTQTVIQSYYQDKNLLHCNFGWDGDQNGYYLSEAFDAAQGPEDPYGVQPFSEGDQATTGTFKNFQFNLQIIKGIRL